MSDFMTPGEVAELLRVPLSTVRYWRVQGTGPAGARIGKHVRYRRSAVEKWVGAQES